jgi:hypothetical protein
MSTHDNLFDQWIKTSHMSIYSGPYAWNVIRNNFGQVMNQEAFQDGI